MVCDSTYIKDLNSKFTESGMVVARGCRDMEMGRCCLVDIDPELQDERALETLHCLETMSRDIAR